MACLTRQIRHFAFIRESTAEIMCKEKKSALHIIRQANKEWFLHDQHARQSVDLILFQS